MASYDNAGGYNRSQSDRSHIPTTPLWMYILRGAQLVVGIIIVGLTGYAFSIFNPYIQVFSHDMPGYPLAWFSFAWMALFFIYLGVTIFFVPVAYNIWVHIVVESLMNIFWLTTFAVLASEANWLGTLWNTVYYRRRTVYSSYSSYLTEYDNFVNDLRNAINCTKAAAGIGALEWLLFIASLIGVGMLAHKQFVRNRADTVTNTQSQSADYKMEQVPSQQAPPAQPYSPQQSPPPAQPAYPHQQAPPQQQVYSPQQGTPAQPAYYTQSGSPPAQPYQPQ